jgi:Trk K+ transport system NAD-binding subunit
VVGKSLKELELRRRFRLNLVAVKRMETTPGGEEVLQRFNPVPLPDDVIQSNDVLALVGSVIDLANFMGEYV